MENHIATAAEIKAAAEAYSFGPPERVVLPKSGFPVILRRPKAIAFSLSTHRLPASLAAKTQEDPASCTTAPSREEIVAISNFWVEMFKKIFVDPKLSLDPGPAEIHPNWLPDEDQTFLIRWAVGEVVSDGASGSVDDLAEFRGNRRFPGFSADGGDLALSPEPNTSGKRGGLSN